MKIIAYVDGTAEPNPGPAGVGVVILDESSGRILHEAKQRIGEATNNVAEYRAVKAAVDWCVFAGVHDVEIRSDSKLCVMTLNGTWRVKASHLKPLVFEIRALLESINGTMKWIPREENGRADVLAHEL